VVYWCVYGTPKCMHKSHLKQSKLLTQEHFTRRLLHYHGKSLITSNPKQS